MSTIYEVEAIIGRRVFSGKVLYLAKWKDFPLQDATWESVKVLKPYRHLIKQYNEQHRNESNHSLSGNQQDLSGKVQQHSHPQLPYTPLFPSMDHQEAPHIEVCGQPVKKLSQDIAPKRRGRPKKNFVEEKQEIIGKTSQIVKKSEQQPMNSIKFGSKTQANAQGLSQVVNKNLQQVIQEKVQQKNGSIKIYLIKKEAGRNTEYIVQDRCGKLSKFQSIEMLRLYPEVLIEYLERIALARLTHQIPYF